MRPDVRPYPFTEIFTEILGSHPGIRRPWGACWMVSVTERVKTLSLTAWKRGRGGGRGGGGGGGRGGYPVPASRQAPTSAAAVSADSRCSQEILRNDICFGLWHQLISVRPATPSEVPDGLRDGPDTCRTA